MFGSVLDNVLQCDTSIVYRCVLYGGWYKIKQYLDNNNLVIKMCISIEHSIFDMNKFIQYESLWVLALVYKPHTMSNHINTIHP